MGDESHYTSLADSSTGSKRKYDEQTVPSSARRATGFSSPGSSAPQSYNSVHLVADEIQLARQKAEEIAARIMSGAVSSAVAGGSDVKRPRFDNGIGGFNSNISYGSYMGATSKKIEIPNGRVGVIIGKSGETIKYLQQQSGAKIQVTRDMDADPNSLTRMVELMGTPIEIDKAEQLINDVLAEADSGGSGTVSRRFAGPGQPGSEHAVINVPNNKVGLVIGKGGETIKNIQASSGARVQVIPLHLPPGDASTERSVHIDGTVDQVDVAKQMVNEVISENRLRNQSAAGGYTQQVYQARPPTGWTPGAPVQQQPGYGYMQPGTYPAASSQYAMPQMPCAGYPPQPASGGYPAANWDQSAISMNQQQSQGYDYYGQPPSSQQQMPPAGSAPLDNTGYSHQPQQASVYTQQGQGYTQDGYAAYPQMGYDQQGYSFAPAYGAVSNPSPVQDGNPQSCGTQGDSSQQPLSQPPATYASSLQTYPPAQQSVTPQAGYGIPTISNPNYATNQPSVQPGYGSAYGPPPVAQKPLNGPPVYGQAQPSSNDPSAYSLAQPPLSSFNQPSDSTPQRTPSYAAPPPQPGYCPPPYGVLPVGHAPLTYSSSFVNGGGYPQPATYSADGSLSGNSRGSYDMQQPLATAQTVQQGGVAQASPSGQT